AEARGITGKAVTPFLLAHVHRATKGQSLQANRALIVANAALAASVALALADKYREPSASTALPRRAGQGETS
ncbi:MAG: pseudouridine-5'-phosphate glycosidase, partial [Isosphaeraceae bacterium]